MKEKKPKKPKPGLKHSLEPLLPGEAEAIANMVHRLISPRPTIAPDPSSDAILDRPNRSSENASPISEEATGLLASGFLALPHALLDRIFAEIAHYSGFKLYLYFYREAFRWVHDERLSAECKLPLTVITKQCAMPNSVARDALKVLVRDRWIAIENRPGASSCYVVNRPVGLSESNGQPKSDRSDRSDRSNQPEKFSTAPVKSGGPPRSNPADTPVKSGGLPRSNPADYRSEGFLAFPHTLLDRILAEIPNTAAFKVYFYLYREAFWLIHDERLSATYSGPLTVIIKQCGISDRVVRRALKVLVRDRWIAIENPLGIPSLYVVNRPIGPVKSGGPPRSNPADIQRMISKEEERSKESSKKGTASVEKHRRLDDDSLPVIKEVYEKLTNNTWTSKDTEAYITLLNGLKVFTFKAEDIIRYIRAIFERTNKPIGSFAYFVKAILRDQESPKTRKTTINKLRRIVESVRNANVGRSDYSNFEFREDVKTAAARAGVPYPPDLLEEAMRK